MESRAFEGHRNIRNIFAYPPARRVCPLSTIDDSTLVLAPYFLLSNFSTIRYFCMAIDIRLMVKENINLEFLASKQICKQSNARKPAYSSK